MSFSYYLPILIIVASNVIYQLSSKMTPVQIDPFASLTVTYAVGTVVSAILFFVFNPGGNPMQEMRHINWTAFALGIVIVGLETGHLLLYRAGWNLNTGYVVHSSVLTVLLLIIGAVFFREKITPAKAVGIGLCISGVFLMMK